MVTSLLPSRKLATPGRAATAFLCQCGVLLTTVARNPPAFPKVKTPGRLRFLGYRAGAASAIPGIADPQHNILLFGPGRRAANDSPS